MTPKKFTKKLFATNNLLTKKQNKNGISTKKMVQQKKLNIKVFQN